MEDGWNFLITIDLMMTHLMLIDLLIIYSFDGDEFNA